MVAALSVTRLYHHPTIFSWHHSTWTSYVLHQIITLLQIRDNKPIFINKVLTSGLLDQSCRREAAHRREAETKQDSTWAPHPVHQLPLEDASNHPTNAIFLVTTDLVGTKKKEVYWMGWTHTISLQPDFDIWSAFPGSTKICYQKLVFLNLEIQN